MGGGAHAPVLTADMAARAIVAAARAYGDDPVRAMEALPMSHLRRGLTAAAGGLMLLGVDAAQIERAMGVKRGGVYTARSAKRAGFVEAQLAAYRAAEFAAWRPDSRESLAGGAAAEAIAPPAAALTTRTAFQPKARTAKPRPAPAAKAEPAERGPEALEPEHASHVNAVIRANGGRGFPFVEPKRG